MPPMPGGQGQNQDNHMAAMWISIGAFIVLAIIWVMLKRQIVEGVFYIKSAELALFSWIIPSAAQLRQQLATMDPGHVTIKQLVDISSQVGQYYVIPTIVILLIGAYFLMKRSMASRFKTMHTMKTLLKSEVKNWPQATPILGKGLVDIDVDEGPWAMAKTPMQFAKEHDLLKIQRKELEEGMLRKDAKLVATLVKSKANQFFIKQLGPRWEGPNRLPMHTRALFAAFIARIGSDYDGSHKLLIQIAKSATGGKLDFSGVNELVAKHVNNDIVQETIRRHAYVLTVMTALLKTARLTGVLASADFLWLKLIDRRLWFMLNTVGRQTPTVEVAGPFAHYRFEAALERPFRTPMIDEATKAMTDAILNQVYTEDK